MLQPKRKPAELMKACVYRRYGGPEVVEVGEVARPVVGESRVLIEVAVTTVTSADARLRAMRMPSAVFAVLGRLVFGVFRPRQRVLGTEVAGVVAGVGEKVTRFAVGDRVVALLGARLGGHAQFVAVDEASAVVRVPEGLTLEEAVAMPFGADASWHYLKRLAGVRPGQRVMVIGASGSLGVAAVQLARHLGAEVTGVCSAANVELVQSLGAAHVIDYTRQDYTAGGETYDVVFDTLGVSSFGRCRAVLMPRGRFLAAVLTMTEVWQMLWTAIVGGKRVMGGVAPERREDLEALMALASAGVMKPVIGRRFEMAEVAEAHRYVDSGRKVGSAVMRVGQG
jgi:NADPH:quinone reductase-like Zn-dependent oxidoreductase